MVMNYNFLKESLLSEYIQGRINEADLENFLVFKPDNFILKHNISAIAQFIKFLQSENNIFLLNGFMGSGKTKTVDIFSDFLEDNVLVFQTSCQEAINLDDILLSYFKDFSTYHNEKRIILPKVESNIFSEKINTYIKSCPEPMLFIFDSFEINLRSKERQKDILDFINFLSHFEKIKIVICSRSFRENDFISSEGVLTHSLLPLTKEQMSDYLNDFEIFGKKHEIDELYKLTRGHFILTELSVLLMNLTHLSVEIYCAEYSKSAKNFLEFVVSKLLTVTPDKFMKLLLLLSTIRHGIPSEFIISRNFATEEDLDYLIQKHIIIEHLGQYYLKDYIKNEYIKTFSAETKIQVHDFLVKTYDEELPLKPFDRELFLSRQTMRQEIAFHKEKIQKLNDELAITGKSKMQDMKDFNYLTYSKTSGYDNQEENKKQKKYVQNIKKIPSDKRKRFELSREDSLLLNSTFNRNSVERQLQELVDINAIEEEFSNSLTRSIQDTDNNVPEGLDDYIEIAQRYESAYNFSSAILYYKKALSYTNDSTFTVKEPIIYTKLAICYKKIQDYDEALRLYEKVYNLYIKDSIEKANQILLSIAQIYNELYKFDKVKETYNRILYSEHGVSTEIVVRCYLDLSELEDNNLDIESALKYAKFALNEAEKISDIKLLSECYFKYALLLDDNNQVDMAQKYYLRCIQSSNNIEENAFLASAYANLAEISLDNNNISAAKMYLELAVNTDKQMNNYEALYYSYTKLAELYREDESSDKCYEYLIKALGASKHLDDISYVVSVYAEIGDYYYDTEDYKRALKSYILAKNLLPANSSDNISNKINLSMNRIKILLGENEFLRLLNEIKRKNNV